MVNNILTPDRRGLTEGRDSEPAIRNVSKGLLDQAALGFTKLLRFSTDTLFAKRYGHRAVGYFEPEALISVNEIDEGRSPNAPASAITIHYRMVAPDVALRNIVMIVRTDEGHHRDINHGNCSKLGRNTADQSQALPHPEHSTAERLNA